MIKRCHYRSARLVGQLEVNLLAIVIGWLLLAGGACLLRVLLPATPYNQGLQGIVEHLPYTLVVFAPAMSILMALRWFPRNQLHAQPAFRFARYGRWASLDLLSARTHPLFGATGIMASLLVGMLINIPVRSAEFMVAIPAIGGEAPIWLRMLFAAMLADVTVLSSLYGVAFVMALRHVPLFPRFLAFVWLLDISAQLLIAKAVSGVHGLPPTVVVALEQLLQGNLKKVLISVSLWLPYLLLSERVNVTYRARVRG